MEDEYLSIAKPSEGLYKEKGSKFISYLYPITTIDNVVALLSDFKKLHPKSRHICYAYRIGIKGDIFRMNDEGEPSGTAGRPIYNTLLRNNLTNVLLAVVRYFGGTKLSASGLINAYKMASRDAILNNAIVTKYVEKRYRIHFDMVDIGKMYNSLKSIGLDIADQNLESNPYMDTMIRASLSDQKIKELVAHFHGLSIQHISHKSFVNSMKIVEL